MLLKACALRGNQKCVLEYRQSMGCARLQDMCTRYVVGDWTGGTYVLVAEADLNLVAKVANLVKDQTVCEHVPTTLHSRLSQASLARAFQGCLLHPCTHFAQRLSCPVVHRHFANNATTGP